MIDQSIDVGSVAHVFQDYTDDEMAWKTSSRGGSACIHGRTVIEGGEKPAKKSSHADALRAMPPHICESFLLPGGLAPTDISQRERERGREREREGERE